MIIIIMCTISNIFRIANLLILILISIFYLACGVDDWHRKAEWKNFDINNLPNQEEYPESEAVVLLNEGTIRIFTDQQISFSTYERHTVTKIFNSRGHRYANVVIPYGSQNSVEEIQARTISPHGKITVLDPETIFDVNLYPNFVFYSDQRAKIFTLPAVEDDCIIEYRYNITIRSQTYGSFWRFQSTIPVLISRFSLIKPAQWELDYRLYDIYIEPKTTIISAGQINSLTWEAREMEAIKTELAMPAMNELGARLVLRPVGIKSWQDISKWYKKLVQSQMSLNEEIEQIVRNLTDGITDDEQKLRTIFEWVRDQVRYVSVSIDIGGYQPHPVAETMRNKYGDCKDMTTLLCAMGQAAGLDVYQALISTRLNGRPDTTLPAAVHFNHVIAYAPGFGAEGIWMDATEKTAPYGQLPWYDQGMPVLVVKPDGSGEIKNTPKLSYSQNRSEMIWRITLQKSGIATIKAQTLAYGTVANEMREKLFQATETEIEDWLNIYLAERVSGTELLAFDVKGLLPVADSLVIDYEFESSHFARKVNKNLVILPGEITGFDLADYFRSDERMQDICFQFASVKQVNLIVDFPPEFSINEYAKSYSIHSEFGKYTRIFTPSQNGFSILYRYELTQDVIPSLRYHEFQEFLENINIRDLDEIVLESMIPEEIPEYLRDEF